MKLTNAEARILDHLNHIVGNSIPINWLKPSMRSVAKRMHMKGLLSKREFARGMVKATKAGQRSLASNGGE